MTPFKSWQCALEEAEWRFEQEERPIHIFSSGSDYFVTGNKAKVDGILLETISSPDFVS